MMFLVACLEVVTIIITVSSLSRVVVGSTMDPIPGESNLYNTYNGTAAPFPGNETQPILPTTTNSPNPDDLLFRNLLAAEWVIFSFYQQGVEAFTPSNFTDAGFKPTTWSRIAEIRDNEAGHLLIFQNALSSSSIKPGPCKYDFGFGTDVTDYLVLQTVIEETSMAFLTGLILQAKARSSKAALVAIAEVETRHLTWALIDVWGANPFAGPADTAFPYANQILDITNLFIVPGSCPDANPVYPYPRQNLPQVSYVKGKTPLAPGSNVTFTFRDAANVPSFRKDRNYYAVFFHGLVSVSVHYDTATNSSVVPKELDNKGMVLAVIADREGAPTKKSVLAGPLVILLQPPGLF